MKTVLITGIYGNLGRAVASKFLELGYQVEGIEKFDHDNHPLATNDRLSLRFLDLIDEKDSPNMKCLKRAIVWKCSAKSVLGMLKRLGAGNAAVKGDGVTNKLLSH